MARELDFVDECYAGKDLSLLKKLTLVIPTYNRNYYLSRCLWYHAHFPFGQIIVADSSPEDIKLINQEMIDKISERFEANILYLEYNPTDEKYGGQIYKKWCDAATHVETDYVQNVTDKEFLIPTTCCESISFLDEHPDYSVADGLLSHLKYNDENQPSFYQWRGDSSFVGENPLERAYESLKKTECIDMQFSVQRKNIYKTIYESIQKHQLYDLRFGETAIELQPLLRGKTHKYRSLPGCCRDTLHLISKDKILSSLNKSESSCSRYPSPSNYPRDYYHKMYISCVNCLFDSLPKKSVDCKEIEDLVSAFINKRYNSPIKILNKVNWLHNFASRVFLSLPDTLKKKIDTLAGGKLIDASIIDKIPDEYNCIAALIKLGESNPKMFCI